MAANQKDFPKMAVNKMQKRLFFLSIFLLVAVFSYYFRNLDDNHDLGYPIWVQFHYSLDGGKYIIIVNNDSLYVDNIIADDFYNSIQSYEWLKTEIVHQRLNESIIIIVKYNDLYYLFVCSPDVASGKRILFLSGGDGVITPLITDDGGDELLHLYLAEYGEELVGISELDFRKKCQP